MAEQGEPALILLVEDNPGIAVLVREKLELDGRTIVHVKTGKAARAWLEQNRPQLVLLDYSLPDMSGFDLVEELTTMPGGTPPFIVTTGVGDERIAVSMMKQGAREYLIKDSNFIENLSLAVDRVLREIVMERQLIKVERALQESEERYQLIFEQAGDYTFLLKPAGNDTLIIVDVNQVALKAHGYSREELLEKPITILDPYITTEEMSEIIRIVNKNGAHIFTSRHICKDGATMDVEINTRLITIENEPYILSMERDITDRKRAEEELRKSEESYSGLFNTVTEAIYVQNPDGSFINVNNGAVRMYGYTREEIIGKTPEFVSAPGKNDLTAIFNLVQRVFATGVSEAFEFWGRRKNGEIFPKDCISNKGKYFGKDVVITTARDVTERKLAENETRRRSRELEILMRVSAALRVAGTRSEMYPVLLQQLSELLKAEGAAIALRNPATGEVSIEFGLGEWKEWTGVKLKPGEGISGLVIASGQSYRTDDAEHDPVVKYPNLFHGLNAAACVPLIISNQPIGALWIGCKSAVTGEDMRLLTAIGDMAANAIQRQTLHDDLQTQLVILRDAQARLVQSEKLAAIGQLVSGVAHELNNPLTSVVLYSQIVQHEKLGETARQNLSKVVSEALRAGRIVRGLLDFARQRPMDRMQVRVDEIIKSSIELVAYELNANDIRLDLQLAPALPVIMADPHQLTQVFVNLLQNAWQAMSAAHGHGILKIATEVGESIYRTHAHEKTPVVRIRFEDDGPGIPEAIIGRIFDPFFTTKPEGKGTGLGLSICHGIISEHGGHIWAESAEGQGTNFIIELPISSAVASENVSAESGAVAPAPSRKSRILIIDDEPEVRDVMSQALCQRGYIVDVAGNGVDGLRLLENSDYKVILCDVHMPGLSGLEFYRQVETNHPDMAKRIVFVTGDAVNKGTNQLIEAYQLNYLTKPFELNDLLQLIQKLA
jgi:PAS domain S-box-containing protein